MKATVGFIGTSHSSNAARSTRRPGAGSDKLGQKLSQYWNAFTAFLAGSSEPRITKIGQDSWRVYDPKNGQSSSFTSEQDVRVWLDQRYNF